MAEIALPIVIVASVAVVSMIMAQKDSSVKTAWFQPPRLIFGIVWLVLYSFVAASWAMVGKAEGYQLQNILFLSITTLMLMRAFTVFEFLNYGFGLLLLLGLIGLVVWLITMLTNTLSVVFMCIFLGWLVFETALNGYILRNNETTNYGILVRRDRKLTCPDQK